MRDLFRRFHVGKDLALRERSQIRTIDIRLRRRFRGLSIPFHRLADCFAKIPDRIPAKKGARFFDRKMEELRLVNGTRLGRITP